VLTMSLLISSRSTVATSQLDPRLQAAASEHRGSSSLGKVQSPRRSTLYWGAWIGKGLTGEAAPWDMGAVRAYEQMVRKPLSIVQWGSPFANCETSPCTPYPFPVTPMNDVRQYGAIPFLSWGAQSIPVDPSRPGDLPDYQLSDLIAGRHDDYIRSFASKAREWGHPFFLRFNWEPNSDWFPWAIKANGNRPNEYVTAWRHVHNIFSSVGAENATWVWCPYVDFKNEYNLRALYPGSRFVDWTCLDGYNWGRRNPANPRPWRSFDELFRTTYRRVVRSIAPRKPMILAELATSNHAGRKGAWLRDMLATLPRDYPKVRGFIYFNENDRNAGWEIESSPAAISAFRRGIQRPAYLANRYGQIDRSPIQPPARR
jgi:Glycosyl hydrolase family 26